MNRIIIIGNGFDLAHKLPTRYSEFINHFWSEFHENIFSGENLESYEHKEGDNLCASFEVDKRGECKDKLPLSQFKEPIPDVTNFLQLQSAIEFINKEQQKICRQRRNDCPGGSVSFNFSIDNAFLKHISETSIENWVDIEEEYFEALRGILSEQDVKQKKKRVETLNKEFDVIKKLLEKYLSKVMAEFKIKEQESIKKAIATGIYINDVSISKRQLYRDSLPGYIEKARVIIRNGGPEFNFARVSDEQLNSHIENHIEDYGVIPSKTLYLNFNYTDTVKKLYLNPNNDIINIHGELGSEENPIIFGYGDELDEDYIKLENDRNSSFSDNLKSIHYLNTDNYGKLREFIQEEPYQIYIMGHSCGNSDRTLLSLLFEHSNCISIKPYFYESGVGKNDYIDKVKSIFRSIKDKKNQKDIVVCKTSCKPLVPFKS